MNKKAPCKACPKRTTCTDSAHCRAWRDYMKDQALEKKNDKPY